MIVTRRTILAATAALAADPAAAQRRGTPIDDIEIVPVAPGASPATRYARLASTGPLGRPRQPIEIEPRPGLRLNLWLPVRSTGQRVVIFSHGELGLPQIYDRMLGHWASHGFAVIAPIHDDSVIEGGLRLRRQDPAAGGAFDLTALIEDSEAWRTRARTCRQALESVGLIERGTGISITSDRPIIVGHSFGAYTAQLLLGARALTHGGEVLEEADARFHAGVLLSPQGRGVMGLVDGSWDTLSRPALVVTGPGDSDATMQAPETKAEPFVLSPPGNKHLAWLARASPTLYAGRTRPGSAEDGAFQDILAVTTAFLLSYAFRDETVFQELAGDYYARMTGGRMATRYR